MRYCFFAFWPIQRVSTNLLNDVESRKTIPQGPSHDSCVTGARGRHTGFEAVGDTASMVAVMVAVKAAGGSDAGGGGRGESDDERESVLRVFEHGGWCRVARE